MPMHCSANVGQDGDAAVFFGLSGTGKTTLSADPEPHPDRRRRARLVGTACSTSRAAATPRRINLSRGGRAAKSTPPPTASAPCWRTSCSIRTRACPISTTTPRPRIPAAAYPLEFIPNASTTGRAGHPKNIVMLTADAFGVMPPIAKLTPAQAMYHFLSGYTAKVAGTEKGLAGAAADVLDLLRRAVHAAPSGRLRQPAARADRASTTSTAGWSTPAGPAATTAPAGACRSRRRARCSTRRSTVR